MVSSKKALKAAPKRTSEEKEGNKLKKIKSFIEKHVCRLCKNDQRYTGVITRKKTHDIKCPECPFVASQLRKHLTSKHHYDALEAKFRESEIRVFYLWTQKDKHGTPKPLPCEIFKIWHAKK